MGSYCEQKWLRQKIQIKGFSPTQPNESNRRKGPGRPHGWTECWIESQTVQPCLFVACCTTVYVGYAKVNMYMLFVWCGLSLHRIWVSCGYSGKQWCRYDRCRPTPEPHRRDVVLSGNDDTERMLDWDRVCKLRIEFKWAFCCTNNRTTTIGRTACTG